MVNPSGSLSLSVSHQQYPRSPRSTVKHCPSWYHWGSKQRTEEAETQPKKRGHYPLFTTSNSNSYLAKIKSRVLTSQSY